MRIHLDLESGEDWTVHDSQVPRSAIRRFSWDVSTGKENRVPE